jgi:hypothetical protein
MANSTARRWAQDRSRVAGLQEHEVGCEAKKTGASRTEMKDAVKSVGNSRQKVERKLGKAQ